MLYRVLLAGCFVACLSLTAHAAPAADGAARPPWIWSAGDTASHPVVYFRKTIDIKGAVKSANLLTTCDDRMELFINGESTVRLDAWQQPMRKDVARALKPGANVIAVRGKNDGGPAALLVELTITLADGTKQRVVTDESWTVSTDEKEGWQKPDFSAEDWKPAAKIAALGEGPWGVIDSIPSAGKSTPAQAMQLLPGFRADLLYSVPAEQGSWVCMTFDAKGRIIASDQYGMLYRITLTNNPDEPVTVEKIDLKIGQAQGLLYVFDSLYLVLNGNAAQGSGLYRVRDTDNDDKFDSVELLKKLDGMGEHGPHAIIRGPADSLYVVAGNFTKIPEGSNENAPHRNYQEDQLLPRLPDGNGHDPHIMAPGGWVAKTDRDGKSWTLLCAGLRNSYDIAFNPDGELFTYDSDMEWDTGASWYRPTRVNHLVSGGEYGWRNGSGKWPAYYPDSLPGFDIGYGSPTGVCFGTGAKFPMKYQRAFFVCDWAYGKMYAMHLTPSGASYTATFEPFLIGRPAPLTDVVIGPDGAMYFTIGGRKTQSGLYRVTYEGPEPVAPAPPLIDLPAADARALRQKLESFHTREDPSAVEFAWPHLDSADRNIRFAARIAIERQPVKLWQERALAETRPTAVINAIVALARNATPDVQKEGLAALGRLQFSSLSQEQMLEALRAYQLLFIRLGKPDDATAAEIANRLDSYFPAHSEPVNRELATLLVYLDSPKVVQKAMKLLSTALTQEDQLHYVLVLRVMKRGWRIEDRLAYFSWLNLAEDSLKGGASFKPFLAMVRRDAVATLGPEEKPQVEAVLQKKQSVPVVMETRPRQFVHNWQMEDFEASLDQAEKGRDYEKGKAAFAAAQCLQCHRFNGEGAGRGPDISGVGSRFSAHDVLESIILPSKAVSDQYQNTRIATKNDVIVGRIEEEDDQKIAIRTHPLAPEPMVIQKKDIKDRRPDKLSMMPEGLLSILQKDEVLDLLAYLRSGGKKEDKAFARQ